MFGEGTLGFYASKNMVKKVRTRLLRRWLLLAATVWQQPRYSRRHMTFGCISAVAATIAGVNNVC